MVLALSVTVVPEIAETVAPEAIPVPNTASPTAILVASATTKLVEDAEAVPVVWLLARNVTLVPGTVAVVAVSAAVVDALNVTVDCTHDLQLKQLLQLEYQLLQQYHLP